MCTTSSRDAMFANMQQSSGSMESPMVIPTVQANLVKANPDEWVLVDVREVDEDRSNAPEGAINMTVGKICSEANHRDLPKEWDGKKVALFCNVGYRSGVACREMRTYGYSNAFSVQHGAKAFKDPLLMEPDHTTVIGTTDPEKVTLALTASFVQQKKGRQALVILFGEGVVLVKKDGDSIAVDKVQVPEPFKPCKTLVANFLRMGGVIAACTTCVKSRGLDYTDLADYTQKIQMPDLLRFEEVSKVAMNFM